MREWWKRLRGKRRAAKEEAKRKGPKDHWFRETIETIATAIIMALVVRHYAIEAFKIPTESMAPTLLGDVYGGGTGDRILVNKWPLYFRGPERWNIVVFRYPLNTSTNYVKRLGGLGGEHLQIRDGDVWIDGSIERKPRDVQDSVWKNFFPEALRDDQVPVAWDSRGWQSSGAGFRVDATGGEQTLTFRADVMNWLVVRPNGRPIAQPNGIDAVGDVRITTTMKIESGDGGVEFVIREHGVDRRVFLSPSGSTAFDGAEEKSIDISIERGESYEVAFANVDDAIDLVIDDESVARFEYASKTDHGMDLGDHGIRVVARRGVVDLGDVRVDRDVHYTGEGENRYLTDIHIPEGHFVMLGDNSNNSKDSRLWEANVFLLKDGTVHQADPNYTNPDTGRTTENLAHRIEDGAAVLKFRDVQGILRTVREADLAAPLQSTHEVQRNAYVVRYRDGSTKIATIDSVEPTATGIRFVDPSGAKHEASLDDLVVPHARYVGYAPFVRREQILGEAFFVFWPASPWRIGFLPGVGE